MVSLVVSAALAALEKMWGTRLSDWHALVGVVNAVFSYVLTTMVFAMIYKVMPRAKVAWRDVLIGASVTALLFTVGKSLIGLYIGRSGLTSAVGAAGSLVMAVVWVYYSAQIFLLGAEFTWAYALTFGSRKEQKLPGAAPAVPSKTADRKPDANMLEAKEAAIVATESAAARGAPRNLVRRGLPRSEAATPPMIAARGFRRGIEPLESVPERSIKRCRPRPPAGGLWSAPVLAIASVSFPRSSVTTTRHPLANPSRSRSCFGSGRADASMLLVPCGLARILEFRGTALFGGMYGRSLPPSDAARVVDAVRAKLRLRKRDVPVERLRNFRTGVFLIDQWTDAVRAHDERRSTPPRLHNTDGDPLLFVTDSFRFDPANRAEIERRLAALEGADLVESASPETEVVFVRTSDDTILGRVTVTAGVLRIETNSEQRADALRRRAHDACAGMLHDAERQRQEARSPGAAPSTASKSRPAESPEGQAVIRKYKERHYRKWLDMPLPALGGKTPRQAARFAASRREVDLLLRNIENGEQRLPEGARFDVTGLRRELGLEE